ncbi:MAG TPA: DUF5916 domain-containing protein [Thermoanaerobaculia bacterium]|nr:DUF5916 domain-containing protein [Thermoanaerobaculia bacterium]
MRCTFLFLLVALSVNAVPTRIGITRLSAPVTIDGDLSDAAWSTVEGVDAFVEYYRGDNTEPPVKTIGRIAYDAEAVYVAFSSEDPRPGEIRAPLVDRDKVLGDQDYVAVLLDTLNERRSGVAFRVNPRGVQTDSVVNDATGEEDFSPDFFYQAVARRTPTGWSAELRIPLSSLRYPASDPQQWGVILMRNYPRDFRYIMANTPIPKNSGCFLCHASELFGLERLPSGSHFTLAPYSTANVSERASADGDLAIADRRFDSDLGLDFKWNPSTRLTLDATLNPDFSQLESDVPQIEVNSRFALSYPEKRTFFLEGTDLLSTPIAAAYTRSITSPAWGMRATGNAGGNAYTFLIAEDRGGGSVILPGPQGSDFAPQSFRSLVALGRVRRSFGESFGGVMVSAREVEGGGHNRLIGPDFQWRRNETDKVSGQFLVSSTENPDRPDLNEQFRGQSMNGHAYRVVFARDAKRYDLWAVSHEYSPGFRADNGFIVQNGVRRGAAWAGLRLYPKGFLSYLRPFAGTEYDAAFDGGETIRQAVQTGFDYEGRWGSVGWVMAGRVRERVGSKLLDRDQVVFEIRAAPLRWLPAISVYGQAGERLDYAGARVGRGGLLNISAATRVTDHLEMQLRTSREWLDIAVPRVPRSSSGSSGAGTRLFDARIDWLKATYTFSPRSLVRAIAQQTTIEREGSPRDRRASLSALYAYKLNWQTVFFVGYGDASITGDSGALTRESRSIFTKIAYAFQR